MNTEIWTRFPNDLMACHGFVSKVSGEMISLIPSQKLILAYMMSRTKFFVENLNKDHFETQETIGKACGIEYKAAGRALRLFLDHGVIDGKKSRPQGSQNMRWTYNKVDTTIDLWVKEDGVIVILGSTKPREAVAEVTGETLPDYSDYFINYEEPEFDGEF